MSFQMSMNFGGNTVQPSTVAKLNVRFTLKVVNMISWVAEV